MAETYTSRTLRELLRIIASRFLGMLIIFALVVGAVTIVSLMQPKTYRSEVVLQASPSRPSPLEPQSTSMREEVSLFVTTQREMIKSDYVLGSALMLLAEHNNAGAKPLTDIYAQLDATATASAKDDAGQTEITQHRIALYDQAETLVVDYVNAHAERVAEFDESVSVVTPGGPDATFTQTFSIRVDWTEKTGDAAKAFDASSRASGQENAAQNAYLATQMLWTAYKQRFSELRVQRGTQAGEALRLPLIEAGKRRDDANRELSTLTASLGGWDMVTMAAITGNFGVDSGPASVVTTIQTRISDLDAKIAEQKALMAAIGTQLAKKDVLRIAVPDEVVSANIGVSVLQQKIMTLKADLAELRGQYTEEYQEVITTREALKQAYIDMRDELVKANERTQMSLSQNEARRRTLEAERQDYQKNLDKMAAVSPRYDQLRKEAEAAQQMYELENQRYLDVLRSQSMDKTPVLLDVLDPPTKPSPDRPRRPILWLNIVIAVAAGLVLALAYAFLSDHFDHSIKSIDDAERYLGTPVLYSVPKLGRRIIRTR